MTVTSRFEERYQNEGFACQRRYPNEALIGFLAANYFRRSAAERKNTRILELGCGSGANLWLIAKEGFDTHGIDFSPTGLAYCEQMLAAWQVEAQLQVQDMTRLDFEPNQFDAMVDVVSMQHLTLKQHAQAYAEVWRCLKPTGKFFSYHLGENSVSLRGGTGFIDHATVTNIQHGYPLADNGQTCFLSSNETRKMLQDAGFVNIRIEKLLRSYDDQTRFIEYLIITADKP